jgi:hypothetical protein
MILTIIFLYLLSVVIAVYTARCVNHKHLDDIPFLLCLIPFINIFVIFGCMYNIFTNSEVGEKINKWYKGR